MIVDPAEDVGAPLRLTPTEQIEAMRARRWLKKANKDVARREAALSVPVPATSDPEVASKQFLKGVQLLAAARHFRDKLRNTLP